MLLPAVSEYSTLILHYLSNYGQNIRIISRADNSDILAIYCFIAVFKARNVYGFSTYCLCSTMSISVSWTLFTSFLSSQYIPFPQWPWDTTPFLSSQYIPLPQWPWDTLHFSPVSKFLWDTLRML